MKLTPCSRARATMRAAVGSSVAPPNIMLPRHSGDTRSPLHPNVRYSIAQSPSIAGIEPTPDAVECPDERIDRAEPSRHLPLVPQFPDHRLHQFGGGLTAWIRRELVERRGWIDDQQFLANYGLSQMVPGATNVNLAVLIGAQLRGVGGALTALAGLLLVPLAILLALGSFYFAAHGVSGTPRCSTPRWPERARLPSASTSRPASGLAGAISAASAPALIAAAIVVGIGILRIPLLEVLLVMPSRSACAHVAAA